MKNNQLTSVLVALLLLSTVTTGWLMYKYNQALHRLRELEPNYSKVVEAENIFDVILKDAVAYDNATKNPEMTRILQSLSNKPAAPAAPAAKPATK